MSEKTIAICLLHSSPDALTETFIRAHVEHLPAEVTVIHECGGIASVGERPVLSQRFLNRGFREFRRRMSGHRLSEASDAYVKVFKRTNAKAVLAEYGPAGVGALTACQKVGVPLIVHFHGYDASNRVVLEKYQAGYQQLFRKAAAIVVVSKSMERRLLELGADRSRLFYNPYGVDCDKFSGAAPNKSQPELLSVGRFVEKKAPHLTLIAFARVAASHPKVRLRMIGEGPLFGPCKDLAMALELKGRVEFLGPRTHEEVLAEMRRARAFVQHSVEASNGDCEGTPVAILEASATGLPVIATTHEGIPDVVVHEKTGLLVDERDVAGMAQGMTRLLVDPEYAGQLGAAGRNRVSQQFSMEQSIESLWKIILHSIGRTVTVHAVG